MYHYVPCIGLKARECRGFCSTVYRYEKVGQGTTNLRVGSSNLSGRANKIKCLSSRIGGPRHLPGTEYQRATPDPLAENWEGAQAAMSHKKATRPGFVLY